MECDVEARVERLPFGALYYNKLNEVDPEALEAFVVFGFADMPFREGEYRGPSKEELSAAARRQAFEDAVKTDDLDTVHSLYARETDEHGRYLLRATIADAMDEPNARRVMLVVADWFLDEESHLQKLAEVAYAEGAFDIFEKVRPRLKDGLRSLENLALRYGNVPCVSVWFPASEVTRDPEAIVARFVRYAGLVPLEVGGVGYFVMLRKSDFLEVWWPRELLSKRIGGMLGVESHPFRDCQAGRTCGAMWLTYVSDVIAHKIGGVAESAVAPAIVSNAPGGALVRASRLPGLGLGDPPTDLGALPNVARLLAPHAPAHYLEHTAERLTKHYSRLFDVPVQPYG